MNAEELYEIVKDWDREAWPDNVAPEFHQSSETPQWMQWVTPSSELSDAHAAALFRDSGLRWLMKDIHKVSLMAWLSLQDLGTTHRVAMYYVPEDEWTELGRGSTELEAISAAIKRERGEHE